MTGQEWLEVIVMVLCFGLAAMASGTETALTSVGRLRIRYLAEQGSKAAATLARLRADPNRFLSTVLFINTLALIVASTATALLSDSLFKKWGVPEEWRLWLTLLDSVLLSVVLLIVAEVTPKTLAIAHAERVALAAAVPVDRIAIFLGPILWAVTFVSRGITGGRGSRAPYLTEEELITALHVSEEAGVIEEQEHQMIHGIIEIGDKTVREIMIPRTDIIAVEKDAGLREIVKLFKQYRHTRMPVYEENFDHVIGLIHTKDLLLFYTLSTPQKFDMDKVLRPIEFTPEQKKVEELNDRLRLGIEESGDYDSVGGYVHAMLGKIAETGDSFQAGRAKWVVEKVKGRRIEMVRLISEEPLPDESVHSSGTTHAYLEEGTGHIS